MTSQEITRQFYEHVKRCTKVISQFHYNGVRYVQCEHCRQVVSTEDCVYYGGIAYKTLFGGCRNCFGNR